MSWQALADAAPDLAAFGAERLHDRVAYLATIKPDGTPRLHPVRPVVADGHLFVFSEPTSPKVDDLGRDGRYMLHCSATGDQPWDVREFAVEGAARRVDDRAARATANAGSAFPSRRALRPVRARRRWRIIDRVRRRRTAPTAALARGSQVTTYRRTTCLAVAAVGSQRRRNALTRF